MSYQEAVTWGQYRKRFGYLAPQLKMDVGFALQAAATTGKAPKDFVHWMKEPEVEATPEDVASYLKRIARGK